MTSFSYSIDPSGHRSRLRERFEKAQTAGMHDYEVLELLLTYAIPRKDVKPIAKNLLDVFKSLSGVFDASEAELLQIPSIGRNSVTLIKLVKELGSLYLAAHMERRDLLSSPEKVVNFLRMKLAGFAHEAFLVIFTNAQNEVLSHEIINQGTIDQVAVYPRRIVEMALARHAAGLIIAHNHPSGYTSPSEEDLRLTRTLKDAARVLDIRLLDHIIVGASGYVSLLERGLL